MNVKFNMQKIYQLNGKRNPRSRITIDRYKVEKSNLLEKLINKFIQMNNNINVNIPWVKEKDIPHILLNQLINL